MISSINQKPVHGKVQEMTICISQMMLDYEELQKKTRRYIKFFEKNYKSF